MPRTTVLAFAIALVLGLLTASLATVQSAMSAPRFGASAAVLTALVFGMFLVNRHVLSTLSTGHRLLLATVVRGVVASAFWFVLNPGTPVGLAALVGFGMAIAIAAVEVSRSIGRAAR